MHSIVTTFRGAVIKVEVANFCAAMDTLIDQDGVTATLAEMVTSVENPKLTRVIEQHPGLKWSLRLKIQEQE